MAKILVTRDGQPVAQQFISGERLVLGRLPSNQLTMVGPEIAERHAEILTLGNDHVLNDLGSPSGTRVNGEQVKRRILQHGDLIAIGRFEIKYLNRKTQESDLDRTLLVPPNAEQPGSSGYAAIGIRARAVEAHLCGGALTSEAGCTTALTQVVSTFGRSGAQVAVIFRRPHGCFIGRVEGEPAKVNSKTISGELHLLNEGDVIEVAGERLRFMESKR